MTQKAPPKLQWHRTDGDSSRWPQTSPPREDDWYFQEVPLDDAKYALYEQKTAEGVANLLGIKGDVSKMRMKLPEGYRIFAHRRRQGDGSLRTDHYVFGSSNALRFRSTREWEPHAVWLADTSKSLDDHTQCGCPYSKSKKSRQSMPASIKRSHDQSASPSLAGSSTPKKLKTLAAASLSEPRSKTRVRESRLKIVRQDEELDEDIEDPDDTRLPATVPERAADLGQQKRRFRKGELVWFRLDTINPPPEVLENTGIGPITHWPALVSHIALGVRGITAPSRSNMNQYVVHHDIYQLRPLGMFCPFDEVRKDPKDLLPWLAGKCLLGFPHGYDDIGLQAMEALREGAELEAKELMKLDKKEREQALKNPPGWSNIWAKKIKFGEMKDWKVTVTRLAFAIRVANTISNSWTLTDTIIPQKDDPDLSTEELKAIAEEREWLYQGMYRGCERLWIEDMVRLKKPWSEVTGLFIPSEGSTERGLFFLIGKIMTERESNAPPKKATFRTRLCGDLYEMIEENDQSLNDLVVSTGDEESGRIPVVASYKAPRGYAFRQLNAQDSMVVCEVSDVAGRLYPDLLDYDKQNWFVDPHRPDLTDGRQEPTDEHLSLMGLKPGAIAHCRNEVWKVDLHGIVESGPQQMREEMKAFYLENLRKHLE